MYTLRAAFLTNEGVTYDAYTLDRWSEEERQETMEQQTPSEAGAPWNKVTSVGTNMRQMVMGPDGNPKAQFTGLKYNQITVTLNIS